MALNPKFPHVKIDEMIWNDAVMMEMRGDAFRVYICAIAWSKSQRGRVPDGILTKIGCRNINATPKDLKELVDLRLFAERPEGSFEILKYAQWQLTAAEEKTISERNTVNGSIGGKARWEAKPASELPPIEAGFNVDEAFELSWEEWPDAAEPRFKEKKLDGLNAFRAHVTNKRTFDRFSAALVKRVKEYTSDARPKSEKRQFLGAFKNFCDPSRWEDWVPKSYQPPTDLDAIPVGFQEPTRPSASAPVDPNGNEAAPAVDPNEELFQKLLDEVNIAQGAT